MTPHRHEIQLIWSCNILLNSSHKTFINSTNNKSCFFVIKSISITVSFLFFSEHRKRNIIQTLVHHTWEYVKCHHTDMKYSSSGHATVKNKNL